MDAVQRVYICVLISVLFVYPNSAGEDRLYLNTTHTNWTTSCGGLGPAVVTGVNMTTLILDGDFSFMSEGQKAWVGYYRRVQYFSLEGCGQIPSTSKKVWMNENSPGHCLSVYRECNRIGLEADACSCISDDEFNLTSFTSVACPYTSCNGGILCGNSTGSWIYAARTGDFGNSLQQSSTTQVQCITVNKDYEASWKASNCDKGLSRTPILCLKNGTVDRVAFNSTQDSWIGAVKMCRSNSDKIAGIDRGNFRFIVPSDLRFQSAWASFITDFVIVSRDPGKDKTDPITCGTIQKAQGTVHLIFEECVSPKPAVCVHAPTKTTPTITSESSTLSTTRNKLTTTVTSVNAASSSTSQQGVSTDLSAKAIPTIEASVETPQLIFESATSLQTLSTKTIIRSTSKSNGMMVESSQTGGAPTKTTPTITSESSILSTRWDTPTTTVTSVNAASSSTSQKGVSTDLSTKATIIPIPTIEAAVETPQLIFESATSLQTLSTKTIIRSTSKSNGMMVESSLTGGDFPMYGWIGLGIFLALVVAGIVLVIYRCKRKRIDNETSFSNQTSDHRDNLLSRIAMSNLEEKDVRHTEDTNETHNTNKYTNDDWGEPVYQSEDQAVQLKSNYDRIQINSIAQNSNGPDANSTVIIDKKGPSGNVYATVNLEKKRSPKRIETRQESDSITYDITYVHNQERGEVGD